MKDLPVVITKNGEKFAVVTSFKADVVTKPPDVVTSTKRIDVDRPIMQPKPFVVTQVPPDYDHDPICEAKPRCKNPSIGKFRVEFSDANGNWKEQGVWLCAVHGKNQQPVKKERS